jgi:hypothetical protein
MLCTPHTFGRLHIQLLRNASKKSLSERPLCDNHSSVELEQASASTLEGSTTRKCVWAGTETIETAMGYMKPVAVTHPPLPGRIQIAAQHAKLNVIFLL